MRKKRHRLGQIRGGGVGQQGDRGSLDGRQRGPKLVAHHGQKLGPEPVQLLQGRHVLQGDDIGLHAGGSSRVDIHTLDPNRGILEKRGSGALRPTDDSGSFPYVARHPNGKFLYALDRLEPPHVVALAIEDEDRGLRRISRTPVGPGSPPHLHVHPSGRWLLVVHYHPGGGYVSVLPLDPDGAAGNPIKTREVGKKTHMVQADPGGNYYFIPCTNSDYIAQFRFDAESGRLEPNDPAVAPTDEGAGPRHMAFHPNGRFAYAVNETNSTVHSWRYDAATGRLSHRETVDSLPSGVRTGAATPAPTSLVSPSGRFVYASKPGTRQHRHLRVDSGTGRLERVGWEQAGGLIRIPRELRHRFQRPAVAGGESGRRFHPHLPDRAGRPPDPDRGPGLPPARSPPSSESSTGSTELRGSAARARQDQAETVQHPPHIGKGLLHAREGGRPVRSRTPG